MTDAEVTGCLDCPLANAMRCGADPDRRFWDSDTWPPAPPPSRSYTPDWCPLRKGLITIGLKSAKCPDCGVNGYSGGLTDRHKLHRAGCSAWKDLTR